MEYSMDNLFETNRCEVAGEIYSSLNFSHETFGESFYTFDIGIHRKSGYLDIITVIVSEKLLIGEDFMVGDSVRIRGQVRTYNKTVEGRNKLAIVIFAREMSYYEFDLDINQIYLCGYICKEPVKRISPLGREICDIMLAVNRMYNKSDYIPCIAWGRNARFASTLDIGNKIKIEGRIQSRNYRKKLSEDEIVTRVAYEVSILNIEEN